MLDMRAYLLSSRILSVTFCSTYLKIVRTGTSLVCVLGFSISWGLIFTLMGSQLRPGIIDDEPVILPSGSRNLSILDVCWCWYVQ